MEEHETVAVPEDRDYVRVPGLFRRWEFERVIEPGVEIRIEEAGEATDGTRLYALYRRDPEVTSESESDSR